MQSFKGYWTRSYLAGVVVRIALVVPLTLVGFTLLFFLHMGQQSQLGVPLIESEWAFLRLVSLSLVLVGPVFLATSIAESTTMLVYGMRQNPSHVIVAIPLVMAALGAILSTAIFVDPEESAGVSDRLFPLGGGLLFFLAGSFQVWAWLEWTAHPTKTTPVGWYASAAFLTAGFLGTLIAWQAPSPYVRVVDTYFRDRWQGQSDPVIDREPLPDDQPL